MRIRGHTQKEYEAILSVTNWSRSDLEKGYPGPRGDKIACKRKLFFDPAKRVTRLAGSPHLHVNRPLILRSHVKGTCLHRRRLMVCGISVVAVVLAIYPGFSFHGSFWSFDFAKANVMPTRTFKTTNFRLAIFRKVASSKANEAPSLFFQRFSSCCFVSHDVTARCWV